MLTNCSPGAAPSQQGLARSPKALTASKDIDWPTFGHDYANTRHASIGQINAANVKHLRLKWKYVSGRYGKFEATPIVVGRTMYLTLPPDGTVVALDATTGDVKWKHVPTLAPVRLCCGPVNRGVAVDGQRVFVATLDDRLMALDARTGDVLWQVGIADPAAGYSETVAPLAWNGIVYVGLSGGDLGARGALSAYSASSGTLLWRWWSVSRGWEGRFTPSPYRDIPKERSSARLFRESWRRGGGGIWMTPALDVSRSTIYLATGNPFPVVDDVTRPGDNLYTDSIVALDARTGKLRWYYQEVAHDRWDDDAASPPVLFDARTKSGSRQKAVGEAGKTGWFYILDLDSGALVRKSEPFVPQWHLFAIPTAVGAYAEPSGGGGAVSPVAFDESSHLVFVTAVQQLHFARAKDRYWQTTSPARYGLTAIDVESGKKTWQHWFPPNPVVSQINNATAGACSVDDVVFVGEESTGMFDGFRAQDGALLWQFQTTAGAPGGGAPRSIAQWLHDWLAPLKHAALRETSPQPASHIHNSAIAYSIDGVEYIAIGGDAFYRSGDSVGDTLYAFTLQP